MDFSQDKTELIAVSNRNDYLKGILLFMPEKENADTVHLKFHLHLDMCIN